MHNKLVFEIPMDLPQDHIDSKINYFQYEDNSKISYETTFNNTHNITGNYSHRSRYDDK